jgi:cbb3-type cytochrome oxidase maturation protein
MCPNCILNQAGLQTGVYVAFGVCLLFFIAAVVAMGWAFKSGEFEDIEGSKFEMLDDGDDTSLSQAARSKIEKLRTQTKS